MGLTVYRSPYAEKQASAAYNPKSTSWFSKACNVFTKTCAAGAKACTSLVQSTVVKTLVVTAIIFATLASPAGVAAETCKKICHDNRFYDGARLSYKGPESVYSSTSPFQLEHKLDLPCSIIDLYPWISPSIYDDHGNYLGELSSSKTNPDSISNFNGIYGSVMYSKGYLYIRDILNSDLCVCIPARCAMD
jgi:hypothetical protein